MPLSRRLPSKCILRVGGGVQAEIGGGGSREIRGESAIYILNCSIVVYRVVL